MNTRELDHAQADRLDNMARSCRMASRPQVLADQDRHADNAERFRRGLLNGMALMALLVTALVAGCVEFAL